jgi:hypothetical protein
MNSGAAEIEGVNAYCWMLDPRLGKFHVYIGGTKAGVAPLYDIARGSG